jgi:hypothetical protein
LNIARAEADIIAARRAAQPKTGAGPFRHLTRPHADESDDHELTPSARMLPVHRRATRVTVLAGSTDVGCVDTAPVSASASIDAPASAAAPAAASAARFNLPQSLCQPDAHTLLIADRGNGRVRLFDLRTGAVRTMAGGGSSSPDTDTMTTATTTTTTATTAAASADSTDATAAAPASTLPSGGPTTSKAAHALSVSLRALSSVCVDPSMPGHVLIGAASSSSSSSSSTNGEGDRRGISRLAPDGALPFVREFFLFLFWEPSLCFAADAGSLHLVFVLWFRGCCAGVFVFIL